MFSVFIFSGSQAATLSLLRGHKSNMALVTVKRTIKPQFCAGLQFVLTSTRSMKNRHAVVTRWPYAMYHRELTSYAALWLLCQINLPSCVARRPLCQTNLPSCLARWPLSQTISNLLPSEEQMRPALPREIS